MCYHSYFKQMIASAKMHPSCCETFQRAVYQRHDRLVAGGQHCPVVKAGGAHLSVKKQTKCKSQQDEEP